MATDSSRSFCHAAMNHFHRCVFAALTIFAAAAPGFAAEYRFDLTNIMGPSGFCLGDCGFDLGTQFSRIDSAELLVRGTFKPSTYLRFGGVPGEFSTGVFQEPFDDISWMLWLGDANTSGFGDIGLGIGFDGVNGVFELQAEFSGVRTIEGHNFVAMFELSNLPVDSADLAFLLDGVGHAQTLTGFVGEGSPALPHFDEITLILNGVAVPEPSALAMGFLFLAVSAGLRPCRAFLR